MQGLIPETYEPFALSVFSEMTGIKAVTREADVALEVWRAANDVTGQLRFPAGADAVALALKKGEADLDMRQRDSLDV